MCVYILHMRFIDYTEYTIAYQLRTYYVCDYNNIIIFIDEKCTAFSILILKDKFWE